MKNNETVKSGVQPITVMFQYEDLGEQVEQRYSGYLVGRGYAMYVGTHTLLIVPVEPTNDPAVYLGGFTFELGDVDVDDPSQSALIVESAARKLNSMTAFEFVTEILMNCKHLYDLGDKLVSASTQSNFLNAALESGVA